MLHFCVLITCWLFLFPLFSSTVQGNASFTETELWNLREDARDAFYHAFDAYMSHAFPADELRPLSCDGRNWENRERGTLDDSLGGYALTLVDALDTFAILGDAPGFRKAARQVIQTVTFHRNVTVSVFEASIRVVGGLLSAHLVAKNPDFDPFPKGEYAGELLYMAVDLGLRLLPAFDTPTGNRYLSKSQTEQLIFLKIVDLLWFC